MSSFINILRKRRDPRGIIKRLAEEFAAYRSIQDQPDQEQFKTYLRSKDYILLFREKITAGKIELSHQDSKHPFEPDGVFVTMMFTFHMGIKDQSGYDNHANLQFTNNQPQFFVGKTISSDMLPLAIGFNIGPRNKYDKLWIPFSDTNQVVFDTTTGFSIFARIKPWNINADGASTLRWIWYKEDDLDNAAQAFIDTAGTLYFYIKKAGTEHKIRTSVGLISPSNWYDCWFIWNNATNTPLIYVNNTTYNTTALTAAVWTGLWSDFLIGNRTFGDSAGAYSGSLDMFVMYRNYIVNSTEVGRHWQNQCTIADITTTAFVGVSIFDRSFLGLGTGLGPPGNDYVNADYVDADYIVHPAGEGGDFVLEDFVDADFIV